MTGKLITTDEAVQATGQHITPCSDCPWRRDSLKGWLGGMTPREWTNTAHHHGHEVECHTRLGAQCAGVAIYRRNVCQSVEPPNLRLEADRKTVFGSRMEFENHHTI